MFFLFWVVHTLVASCDSFPDHQPALAAGTMDAHVSSSGWADDDESARTQADLRKDPRYYVQPPPIHPMPPIAGPNSIAPKIQPADRVVKNMNRLRHDEMPSWTGIAALRNLVDGTLPDDQQKVVDSGGAEAIIATMQAWPDHAGIQVAGSGTLVKIAEVNAAARKRVLVAGGIFELAAAVARLEKHADTDGDAYGKHIVHKANFARDCLLKVAGKATDPRNKKHIQAAIEGGVDKELFRKLDPKVREKMEQEAHAAFLVRKAAQDKAEEEAEEAALLVCPWKNTLERDRETCVLFPGQGAQKVGMANKLLECHACKELFQRANAILGYDLLDLCVNGPQDKLDQTLYSQPAIFVTSLAAVEKAKRSDKFEMIGRTKTAAGYSLGEYTALVYGQAMSFEDGLRLVKARAEAMDAAARAEEAGMATISGVDDATLRQMLAAAIEQTGNGGQAYIANYMFPEGRTCSGDIAVLKKLCELVGALGAGKSGKLLNVSGAFHTPYMQAASDRLAHALDTTTMQQPTIRVLSNVTGEYFLSPEHIRELLKRQLVEPVKWEQQMDEACAKMHKHATFVETGPGRQLKAMMRRLDQDAFSKMVVLE